MVNKLGRCTKIKSKNTSYSYFITRKHTIHNLLVHYGMYNKQANSYIYQTVKQVIVHNLKRLDFVIGTFAAQPGERQLKRIHGAVFL